MSEEPFDLYRVQIPPTIIDLIPESIAREYRLIPIRLDGNHLVVATAEKDNRDVVARLEFLLNPNSPPPAGWEPLRLQVVLATQQAIDYAISLYYPGLG